MRSWKTAVAALVLLVIAIVVVLNLPSFDSRAAVRGDSETPGDLGPGAARLREALLPVANERLARIQHELADLGEHPWAGVYGWGESDGTSARLTLAPGAGFVYFRTARDGSKDVNHGEIVSAKPSRLLIEPALDPTQNVPRVLGGRALAPLDAELFPVRWGVRRYLIAKSEMQAFCNAVNSGREAAEPRFFYRHDQAGHFVQGGLPSVPEPYVEWLLPEPLAGEIVAIVEAEPGDPGRAPSRPLVARIGLGRVSGVRPGMQFWLVQSLGYGVGEVLECDDATATIEFQLDVRSTREIEPLRVGWRVSTRAPAR